MNLESTEISQMDSVSRLKILVNTINRHEELKQENCKLKKRCEHLERIIHMCSESIDRTNHVEFIRSECANHTKLSNATECHDFCECNSNTSGGASDSPGSKINRFSKRLKSILLNKHDDLRHNFLSHKRPSKISNDLIGRSKSEDETGFVQPISPSLFLVSEISKQMCGHHGWKLNGLSHQARENALKLQQVRDNSFRGHKSNSLSIDTTQHLKLSKTRRASCDVVSYPERLQRSKSHEEQMVKCVSQFKKDVSKSPTQQVNYLLTPTSNTEVSPSLLLRSPMTGQRRVIQLSTLHEEELPTATSPRLTSSFSLNFAKDEDGKVSPSGNMLSTDSKMSEFFSESSFNKLKMFETETSNSGSIKPPFDSVFYEPRAEISKFIDASPENQPRRRFLSQNAGQSISSCISEPTPVERNDVNLKEIIPDIFEIGPDTSASAVIQRSLLFCSKTEKIFSAENTKSCKFIEGDCSKELQLKDDLKRELKESLKTNDCNLNELLVNGGKKTSSSITSGFEQKTRLQVEHENMKEKEGFRKNCVEDDSFKYLSEADKYCKNTNKVNESVQNVKKADFMNSEIEELHNQLDLLNEHLITLHYKNSFLNALFASRSCLHVSLQRHCMQPRMLFSIIGDMRRFQIEMKNQIKNLFEVLRMKEDQLTVEEIISDAKSLKELEEILLKNFHKESVSSSFFTYFVFRILALFHKKFVEIKDCLNRKDLIVQHLENYLLLEHVTNKLLNFKNSRKRRKLMTVKDCNFSSVKGDNDMNNLYELQRSNEYECTEKTELLENEINKIVSKATKESSRSHLQRQLAQEQNSIQPNLTTPAQNIKSFTECPLEENLFSTNSIDSVSPSQPKFENKAWKCSETLSSSGRISQSYLINENDENNNGVISSPQIDVKSDGKTKSSVLQSDQKNNSLVQFSLNDLLVNDGKNYDSRPSDATNDDDYLRFEQKEIYKCNQSSKSSTENLQNSVSSSGHQSNPCSNLSIFRPSSSKPDWVVREARLPYFEISSFSASKLPTIYVDDRESTKIEADDQVGSTEVDFDHQNQHLIKKKELHSPKSDSNHFPISFHHLQTTVNRRTSVAECISNHSIPNEIKDGNKLERHSSEKWSSRERRNSNIDNLLPVSNDSFVSKTDISRRSSKSLFRKISPSKSPLNICKSLCLVNSHSVEDESDKTNPQMSV